MRNIFGKSRSDNMRRKKLLRYFAYALGEIVLVVIGILIALQISNMNDAKKDRVRELHYLANIKADMLANGIELDKYIAIRIENIELARGILEYADGKPITDVTLLNEQIVRTYIWKKFFQTNNTFQELTKSGNLALITSDSVKQMLLNLESLYQAVESEEAHFRYDAEVLIYEPAYNLMDLNSMIKTFSFSATNGKSGKHIPLQKKHFERYLADVKVRNGFVMMDVEYTIINRILYKIQTMSTQLVKTIDRELMK
jgi:hypothetical protein